MVPASNKSPSKASVTIPCGRCVGCRLDKARDWSLRVAHEASLHEDNSFLTLTYDDENLPLDASVSVRELQLFFKRLRFELGDVKVRYFACGEYGDRRARPHYHVILFGYGFPDRRVWRKASSSGRYAYRSPLLEAVWPFGASEIGSVTRESGAYVARYCLKKVTGPLAEENYTVVHPLTGQVCRVQPEFILCSRRPGIGADWFKQFERDCFPSDFCVLDGKKYPVPKYYKDKLKDRFTRPVGEGETPREDRLYVDDDYRPSRLKGREAVRSDSFVYNSSPERLAVREECQLLRQGNLSRNLGEE